MTRACARLALSALLGATALSACGDGDDSPAAQTVALEFAGHVGDAPFDCGASYPAVGATETELTALDFRFYVHDVRLLRADGSEVAVALEQDGMWQVDDVALLDFEDGTDGCEGGNAQTNSVVRGTVPAGSYEGVRFTLGVPFERNHADATVAPAPLNLTSMFWNWNGGYKFFRFDGSTTGLPDGMRLHLGSTGCDGDMMGNVTECANPNRVSVALDEFDPASDVVVADLAGLFEGVDLDTNTADTPPGCMAAPSDPDCASVFGNLGLPFDGATGGEQTLFRVQ